MIIGRFFVAMTSKWYNVVGALIVTHIAAAFLFKVLEGWRFLDALWWGHVAALTIGYGDIAPKTDLGREVAMVFQYFWIYYCTLAIGAHFVAFLFRNKHILTHLEQLWMFKVLRVLFDWVRWCVIVQQRIAQERGIQVPPLPHTMEDGVTPIMCPRRPADTDHGNIEDDEEGGTVATSLRA